MPTYVYIREDSGECIEVVMSIREMEERQGKNDYITLEDGAKAHRSLSHEHGNFKNTPGNWPMVSTAAGVHPDQRKEAEAYATSVGVPTEFNNDGDPVFRSRSHRKEFLKAHRMRDNDGGFGD